MIILIASVARNGVIGFENGLPWHLPGDMRRFKRLTTGHAIIMGRSTFESLTGPLPNRTNIVLTRNPDYAPAGVQVADSLSQALKIAEQHHGSKADVYVIGGSQIYTMFLPLADKMELTVVDVEPRGDAWFPLWNPATWHEIEFEAHPGEPSFEIKTLVRSRAHPPPRAQLPRIDFASAHPRTAGKPGRRSANFQV